MKSRESLDGVGEVVVCVCVRGADNEVGLHCARTLGGRDKEWYLGLGVGQPNTAGQRGVVGRVGHHPGRATGMEKKCSHQG